MFENIKPSYFQILVPKTNWPSTATLLTTFSPIRSLPCTALFLLLIQRFCIGRIRHFECSVSFSSIVNSRQRGSRRNRRVGTQDISNQGWLKTDTKIPSGWRSRCKAVGMFVVNFFSISDWKSALRLAAWEWWWHQMHLVIILERVLDFRRAAIENAYDLAMQCPDQLGTARLSGIVAWECGRLRTESFQSGIANRKCMAYPRSRGTIHMPQGLHWLLVLFLFCLDTLHHSRISRPLSCCKTA